jgi:hypothetical protein
MEIPTFLLFDPVGLVNIFISDANGYTHYAHINPWQVDSE